MSATTAQGTRQPAWLARLPLDPQGQPLCQLVRRSNCPAFPRTGHDDAQLLHCPPTISDEKMTL
jgi:hypothetical protein